MRWPWSRTKSQDQLVVSWSNQTLAFVRARSAPDGLVEVLELSVERMGTDSMEAFAERLQAKGLEGMDAVFVLRPEQCQVLQIAAPVVPPEELRAAARYQIRDMVDLHIDDITLDVAYVGDGKEKNGGQLFAVVAANAVVKECMALAGTMHWDVDVMDIEEMAQRNLQAALAQRNGTFERAEAVLMVTDERLALLTVSAKGELYFTRRLELPQGFMAMDWGQEPAAVAESFTPVSEYVPEYNPDTSGYGGYNPATVSTTTDADRLQRLVVEVQRSLDLWDRTWSNMPLLGLRVCAGDRSEELATWLGRETGQRVSALNLDDLFSGLQASLPADRIYCSAVLGALLRT
jgi:MSHA biogenesis protein MshI